MTKNFLKIIVGLQMLLCSVHSYAQVTKQMYYSTKLGEKREITIGLPPSYGSQPDKKYPLLFLLDGDYLFDPFEGELSYGAFWDDLPEVIVVGISQNKKNERESDCSIGEINGLPIDKGNSFFEFIGMELIPYIQLKYRIAPFKIIAGHDITAGFLNFYLYKDSPIFDGYISMSPELTNGMKFEIPEHLAMIKKPIFYYQSTADGDVSKMQTQIKELDSTLKSITIPKLNYKFDEFIGESHYSLVSHSIPNALRQFFSAYSPISTKEFLEVIAKLPSGHVDYLINKYNFINKYFNIKMPIRMNDFRAIESAILINKTYDEFEILANLAKKDYPNSMLSDYYLALMYEKKGDVKKSVKSYRDAFLKEEIRDLTKEMMVEKADELKKQ